MDWGGDGKRSKAGGGILYEAIKIGLETCMSSAK
jgi:hypothetical protein